MSIDETIVSAAVYIDKWLEYKYSYGDTPGFVVAIQHKNKLIYEKAFGYANLETKTNMTTEAIYRIASHSKMFTATAILQLQEAGKLHLDDPAAKHVNWLKKHTDIRWKNVTIRQLLSHGAGVIRDGLSSDYWNVTSPFPDKVTFKKELLSTPLIIENNTKLKYSNFGYTLLGFIVEAASGQPYNDYVLDNIVNKLGLKNCGPEYVTKISNKMVTGYTLRDRNKQRLPIGVIDTHAMSSATGFYATAKDLCAFGATLYNSSTVLISSESKKEMQKVHWSNKYAGEREEYGLGIEIEHVDNRLLVGHGGGFPGQITETLVDPADEIVVCVLTNCRDGKAVSMNKGIYNIINWFIEHSLKDTKVNYSTFEGRFFCTWGTTDIVAYGDSIIAINPDSWLPCKYPESLQFINQNTLKITQTSGFTSFGELVHFYRDNGKITKIIAAGATMLPEEAYWNNLHKKNLISS